MADFLRRMREPLLLALLVASGLLLLLWLAEFGIWIRGFSGSGFPSGSTEYTGSAAPGLVWLFAIAIAAICCLIPPTPHARCLIAGAAVLTSGIAGISLLHWGLGMSGGVAPAELPARLSRLIEALAGLGCAVMLWRLLAVVHAERSRLAGTTTPQSKPTGTQPVWDPLKAVGRQWARAGDAASATPNAASSGVDAGAGLPGSPAVPQAESGPEEPRLAADRLQPETDFEQPPGHSSRLAELSPAPPVRRTTWSRGGIAPETGEPAPPAAAPGMGVRLGQGDAGTSSRPWLTAGQTAGGKSAAADIPVAQAGSAVPRPAPDWRPAQRTT